MKIFYSFIILIFISISLNSQENYSDLEKEGLDNLIKSSNLIVEGQVEETEIPIKIKVLTVLKGPKPIRTISVFSNKKNGIEPNLGYIFFLEKIEDKLFIIDHPKSVIKSDVFVLERTDKNKDKRQTAIRDIYLVEHIKKQVMKWRIETSEVVSLATIKAVEEKNIENNLRIFRALCGNIASFKGDIEKEFVVEYIRDVSKNPPPLFLFPGLPHILFLVKENDSYTIINEYDGAFLERKSIIEEIKILTKLQNPLDNSAGKEEKGIIAICPSSQTNYEAKEDIILNLLIRNTSDKAIEIYNEEIQYFVLFHIFKEDGSTVPVKYPRNTNIPSIKKNSFLVLKPGEYFYNSFNISKFCQLPAGKYNIYLEFNLPWEYSGKTLGKAGWTGKVISNKLDIIIEN